MNRNAIIGDLVRYYRTSRDMSMQKLADALAEPFTHQQMAKYETGKSRWPADLLLEIADILEVDIQFLMVKKGINTDNHEAWAAERYKSIMLKLPFKARQVVYSIIDGVVKIVGEIK